MTARLSRATMVQIATEVAALHGLTPGQIQLRTHEHHISHPRQEAMLCQREAGAPWTQIARFWGYDHSTVMHACRSAAARREPTKIQFRTSRIAA